jgi:hypothetical protein
VARKRKQRVGITFEHRQTKRPVVWITQYDKNWKNQDNPNLYRVRCWKDLPDLSSFIDDTTMAGLVLHSSGYEGLYYYFQAFFHDFCACRVDGNFLWWIFYGYWKSKADRKESAGNCSDWWFKILPSGFPNGKIPDQVNIVKREA